MKTIIRKTIVISALIVVLFLLPSCLTLPDHDGLSAITGNIVHAGYEEQNVNDLAPTPIKQPSSACSDGCTPKGTFCIGDQVQVCHDTDNDGCLDLSTIHCTFGCKKGSTSCNIQPQPEVILTEPKHKTQDEILRPEKPEIPTMEGCNGRMRGVVEWNPDHAICRRKDGKVPSAGYPNILTCCKRFFSGVSCTKNLGILQRGIVMSSQYYGIGCYDG